MVGRDPGTATPTFTAAAPLSLPVYRSFSVTVSVPVANTAVTTSCTSEPSTKMNVPAGSEDATSTLLVMMLEFSNTLKVGTPGKSSFSSAVTVMSNAAPSKYESTTSSCGTSPSSPTNVTVQAIVVDTSERSTATSRMVGNASKAAFISAWLMSRTRKSVVAPFSDTLKVPASAAVIEITCTSSRPGSVYHSIR